MNRCEKTPLLPLPLASSHWALLHTSPPKGAQLEPRQGWVLLAHGETVGHGAPRHQTLALVINRYLPTPPSTTARPT